MRVSLLGPVAVERDGAPLTLGGVRLRALLARLALDAGRVVPVARLVEDLWEGAPPADPAHALQSLVSRLRGALGAPELVVGDGGGYRLALAAEDVDVLRAGAESVPWRGAPLSDPRRGLRLRRPRGGPPGGGAGPERARRRRGVPGGGRRSGCDRAAGPRGGRPARRRARRRGVDARAGRRRSPG